MPGDRRVGHVHRRLERYSNFFFGRTSGAGDETWYAAAFPDRFAAEILVLARSAHTCRRLDALVRAYYGRDGASYPVRVLTTEAAIASLSREFGGTASTAPALAPATTPGPPPLPPRPAGRVVTIDDEVARRLRQGLDLFVKTYNSMRQQASDHDKVCPSHFRPALTPAADLNAFNDFVYEVILGTPRRRPQAPPTGRSP
jgi:hypothetical protein